MVLFKQENTLLNCHIHVLYNLPISKTVLFPPQLLEGYKSRENAIKRCIHEVSNNIRSIKDQRDVHPDDSELSKQLRSEQTKVNMLREKVQ
jgi:hypothetical protein